MQSSTLLNLNFLFDCIDFYFLPLDNASLERQLKSTASAPTHSFPSVARGTYYPEFDDYYSASWFYAFTKYINAHKQHNSIIFIF